MKNSHNLELIAMVLLVIGGLNWGLYGLFNLDVISAIFGEMSALSRIIYVVVGLAAVYRVVQWLNAKSSK
jgi:hypothetical protein